MNFGTYRQTPPPELSDHVFRKIKEEREEAREIVSKFRKNKQEYSEYKLTKVGEISSKPHSRKITKYTYKPMTDSYISNSNKDNSVYTPYSRGRSLWRERDILAKGLELDDNAVFHRRIKNLDPKIREELLDMAKPGVILGSVAPLYCAQDYSISREYGSDSSVFDRKDAKNDVVFHFFAPTGLRCKYHFFKAPIMCTMPGVDFLIRSVSKGVNGATHIEAELLRPKFDLPNPVLELGASQPFPTLAPPEVTEQTPLIKPSKEESWWGSIFGVCFGDDESCFNF